MKHLTMRMLCLAFAFNLGGAQAQQPLQCDVGPLNRNYGNSAWLVYSCSDEKTFVFVSAPGSPAFPFIFSLFPKDGAYRLNGEGTGSKAASDAAGAEIQRIAVPDLANLLAQTKAARAANKK